MMAPVLFGFNVLTVSFGRIAQPDIRSYDAKLRNISLICGAVLGTACGTLLRLTSPLCDSAMMIMQRTLEDAAVRPYKIKKTALPCPRLRKNMYISEEHDKSCSDHDKSCSDFYSQALQVLTGPEKRTTADQVLSFIVQFIWTYTPGEPRYLLCAYTVRRNDLERSQRYSSPCGASKTNS